MHGGQESVALVGIHEATLAISAVNLSGPEIGHILTNSFFFLAIRNIRNTQIETTKIVMIECSGPNSPPVIKTEPL